MLTANEGSVSYLLDVIKAIAMKSNENTTRQISKVGQLFTSENDMQHKCKDTLKIYN